MMIQINGRKYLTSVDELTNELILLTKDGKIVVALSKLMKPFEDWIDKKYDK